MQLFILDYDPAAAAGMLCDSHLRKMCMETAQILSSVIVLKKGSPGEGIPKPYNLRHPVIRAVDSQEKINWVLSYLFALHREYFRRYGKRHAYYFLCLKYKKILYVKCKCSGREKLDFARDFGGIEIPDEDLVSAYRKYYRYKKSVLKNWSYTNSGEPEWLK